MKTKMNLAEILQWQYLDTLGGLTSEKHRRNKASIYTPDDAN